jgi:Tfp pilus assembly pilus retraction ATPase PilT
MQCQLGVLRTEKKINEGLKKAEMGRTCLGTQHTEDYVEIQSRQYNIELDYFRGEG